MSLPSFFQAYLLEFTVFINKCQGLLIIIKRDFFRLFQKVQGTAFIEKNVFPGFKNTGLYLFDPEVVIKRFRVKKKKRPLNNKSIGLALKTDDQRRINILIKKITNKKAIKNTQKLLIKIYDLIIQNILFRIQNKGLKNQLINERKRRKRKELLFIDFPANKHS